MLNTKDWYCEKQCALMVEKEQLLAAMSGLPLNDEKREMLLRLKSIETRLAGINCNVELWGGK